MKVRDISNSKLRSEVREPLRLQMLWRRSKPCLFRGRAREACLTDKPKYHAKKIRIVTLKQSTYYTALAKKTNKQETPYLNIHHLTGKLKYTDIGRKLGQNSSMGVGVSRGWGHLSTNHGLLCYGINIVLRSAGQKSGPTVKSCHNCFLTNH